MIKTIFYFLIFTLIFATTSACASETSHVDNEDNAVFEISYLSGSRISSKDDLEILVRNVTSNCIKFPRGYGIKVYVEIDNKRIEIPNLVTYIGSESITIAPMGEITSRELIYLQPDASGLAISKPINAYVTIRGHVCGDESRVVEEEIPFTLVP